jgi:hypothetical protein
VVSRASPCSDVLNYLTNPEGQLLIDTLGYDSDSIYQSLDLYVGVIKRSLDSMLKLGSGILMKAVNTACFAVFRCPPSTASCGLTYKKYTMQATND